MITENYEKIVSYNNNPLTPFFKGELLICNDLHKKYSFISDNSDLLKRNATSSRCGISNEIFSFCKPPNLLAGEFIGK